jgi:hypothetical protein
MNVPIQIPLLCIEKMKRSGAFTPDLFLSFHLTHDLIRPGSCNYPVYDPDKGNLS